MEAVIFDMDGVIIDSEPVHFRLETELFSELGLTLSREEHESFLGTSSHGMFCILKERYGLKASVEDLVDEERRRYLGILESGEMPVIPGIPELVEELADRGCSIAVASSAPHEQIDRVMERSGLAGHFEVRISGDDVPRSKPDPAIFLKAAEELGVSPFGCWVLEDSANGIRAGGEAGMNVIAYRAPQAPVQDFSGADFIVTAISEVINIIGENQQ